MSLLLSYLLVEDILGTENNYQQSAQLDFLTKVNELNHKALTMERRYGEKVESYYDYKDEHPITEQSNASTILLTSSLLGIAAGGLTGLAIGSEHRSNANTMFGALFGGLVGTSFGSFFIKSEADINLDHVTKYESFLDAKQDVLMHKPRRSPDHKGLQETTAEPLEASKVSYSLKR